MIKCLKIILTVLITSFYFFPVYFTFLPAITKNLLAVLGLVFIIIELIRKRDISVSKELLILLLFCGMVSIISLISITYNETPDTTYVTFIRSTVIWLCGAFSVIFIIRSVHGRIDVPLIIHYLIGACLFQCVSAMLIQFIPAFEAFVDTYVQQGQSVLKDMGRIYGIGAALDVAGSRFAAVLVGIAFLLASSPEKVSVGKAIFYTFSFVVITAIGNMIARTTLVGSLIGLAWIVLAPFAQRWKERDENAPAIVLAVLLTLSGLIVLSIFLYNSSPRVNELLRFGFEGFFSYFETGEWETASTNTLEKMVVWPEELKTWVIGDGYFENSRYDPNYLGDATTFGYYMGTDIGYLRFLFYFGLSGLVWIIAILFYLAYVCSDQFKQYTVFFIMALCVGLAVWAKVATDLFLFFYLFLCAAELQKAQGEEKESSSENGKTT